MRWACWLVASASNLVRFVAAIVLAVASVCHRHAKFIRAREEAGSACVGALSAGVVGERLLVIRTQAVEAI